MLVSGSDLMAFVSSDTNDPRSIGCATSHTLEITNSLKTLSHKDLGAGYFQYSEFGEISWSCSSENFVCDTSASGEALSNSDMVRAGKGYDDMYEYLLAKKPIWLEFGLEGLSKNFKDGKVLDVAKDTDGKEGWKPGKTVYGGWAWINSLSLNAPVGDYATMSISFTGHGPLKKITHDQAQGSDTIPFSVQTPVTTKTTKTASTESK